MKEISHHNTEILAGDRFKFGENWARFLRKLSSERIAAASTSLGKFLRKDKMAGLTFLDAGCGSGLFSLAASNLGASVYSFDYDPKSVACAASLKERYGTPASEWIIETGSVLDSGYLATLGKFDVVYSWGVLHHTGAMWTAIENISATVKDGGQLFIAIYNDQRLVSRYWKFVKHAYNKSALGRLFVTLLHLPYLVLRFAIRLPGKQKLDRGMSLWNDYIDWLGGYPFEVAKPEQIFAFLRDRGFILEELVTCGGRQGCNEFVFRKISHSP